MSEQLHLPATGRRCIHGEALILSKRDAVIHGDGKVCGDPPLTEMGDEECPLCGYGIGLRHWEFCEGRTT